MPICIIVSKKFKLLILLVYNTIYLGSIQSWKKLFLAEQQRISGNALVGWSHPGPEQELSDAT